MAGLSQEAMIEFIVTDRFPTKYNIAKLQTGNALLAAHEQVAKADGLRAELD